MMPERTNIGTARSGKLSSPPNIALMRYFAPTVNDGSKMCGNTAVIPSVMPTGIAIIRNTTNSMNNNPTGMATPFRHQPQMQADLPQQMIQEYCVQDEPGQ